MPKSSLSPKKSAGADTDAFLSKGGSGVGSLVHNSLLSVFQSLQVDGTGLQTDQSDYNADNAHGNNQQHTGQIHGNEQVVGNDQVTDTSDDTEHIEDGSGHVDDTFIPLLGELLDDLDQRDILCEAHEHRRESWSAKRWNPG